MNTPHDDLRRRQAEQYFRLVEQQRADVLAQERQRVEAQVRNMHALRARRLARDRGEA